MSFQHPCAICGKLSQLHCQCKKDFYCSERCQRAGWRNHRLYCSEADSSFIEPYPPRWTTDKDGKLTVNLDIFKEINDIRRDANYILPPIPYQTDNIIDETKDNKPQLNTISSRIYQNDNVVDNVGALKEHEIPTAPLDADMKETLLEKIIDVSKKNHKVAPLVRPSIDDLWKQTNIFIANRGGSTFEKLTRWFKDWVEIRPYSLVLIPNNPINDDITGDYIQNNLNSVITDLAKPGQLFNMLNDAKSKGDKMKDMLKYLQKYNSQQSPP